MGQAGSHVPASILDWQNQRLSPGSGAKSITSHRHIGQIIFKNHGLQTLSSDWIGLDGQDFGQREQGLEVERSQPDVGSSVDDIRRLRSRLKVIHALIKYLPLELMVLRLIVIENLILLKFG